MAYYVVWYLVYDLVIRVRVPRAEWYTVSATVFCTPNPLEMDMLELLRSRPVPDYVLITQTTTGWTVEEVREDHPSALVYAVSAV